MHQALYRKYRPQTFDDVYGQDHITTALRYEVANGKVSHAYLFCGSRGTGKTTCAKILAKAANCLSPVNGDPCGECEACRAIAEEATVDIIEMDAASYTSVNDIRVITDAVVYSPAMLKTRVYIIDEVHMLSTAAFNALLKTLEEPPEKVIFILATTELHKLPITVTSRCQRFDFRRIKSDIIADRLFYISEKEGISIDRESAMLIAKLSNGGMRDAISLLEVVSGKEHCVTVSRIRECAGISGRENIISTVLAIAEKDWEKLFSIISELISASTSIVVFWQDLIAFYRDMMVAKTTKNALKNYELTDDEIVQVKECASKFTLETIMQHSRLLDKALGEMQYKSCDQRICAELTFIRMTEPSLQTGVEALLARIAELEERVNLLSCGITPATPITANKPKSKEAPIQVSNQQECKPAKVVTDWADIVNRFKDVDPATSAFLSNAKATVGNGEFLITVSDSFSKMMIEGNGNLDKLSEIIVRSNPNYALLTVKVVENAMQSSSAASPFDEINF